MKRATDLADLLHLRKSGMSDTEMALKLGVSKTAVHQQLARAGIPMSRPISPRSSVRLCLSCGSDYVSTSPYNRICDGCRSL